MSELVRNPYPIFTDSNGDPLEEGYIYIGVAGLSPLTNPLQAYWDAALTNPAANIRTKGGYPSNSGTPGRLYTADNYSILVQDKRGITVYTQFNAIDYLEAPLATAILKVDTIADLRLLIPVDANVQVSVGGSAAVGDGLVAQLYYWDPNSAAVDNGVTIVQPTAATGFGRWLIINNATIPTETVNLTFADTGDTLALGFLNKIYLVDTDGGATALVVPDGDFDGQEVTLSNEGSSALTINGSGIVTDLSIPEAVLLTWLASAWGITSIGSLGLDTLAVNTLTAFTPGSGVSVQTPGGEQILTKIIEIGDWNMNAGSKIIAHGVTDFNKIRSIAIVVRDDGNNNMYNLNGLVSSTNGESLGAWTGFNATNLTLFVVTTLFFGTSPNFVTTPYNRGWVTITYEV